MSAGAVEGAVLTLNAGSSSLKVALYPATGERPLATGIVDRIGPGVNLEEHRYPAAWEVVA